MAEMLQESSQLESTTVKINRTAATIKGGRRMSFSALVVVGDRRGNVGIGYGKAPGVPAAIEKAQKDARKSLTKITLEHGTLPHPVTGKFGSSTVRLIPAAPGTGVVASATVRAVLEMVGVHDCLTKAYGSTNEINVCKAVMEGLGRLQLRSEIERIRGVKLDPTDVEVAVEASSLTQLRAQKEAEALAARNAQENKEHAKQQQQQEKQDQAKVQAAKDQKAEDTAQKEAEAASESEKPEEAVEQSKEENA